jgi:aspartate aminotransferase-like enzyme
MIKGEFDKTLVVDGISSIGSLPCPVDDWGIDVAISGSQKGWMSPPGLAMVSVSPRAWEAIAEARMPRFYFDLGMAKGSLEKGETPWTPAIGVMYALREGLRLMFGEGMENVYRRHAQIGESARRGAESLGLDLFAHPSVASNTVTAIRVPPDVEWKALSELLRNEHGVVFAGGQGLLSGKLFRIGHLGWVSVGEIERALAALEDALAKLRSGGAVPAGGA